MNAETKLQITAGLGAVVALPIILFSLKSGGELAPWFGLALFGCSMMVTPILRIVPSTEPAHEGSQDV